MDAKTENLSPVQLHEVGGADENTQAIAATKRAFIEPEVSFPVDVLEATTFFQVTDSGVTNP